MVNSVEVALYARKVYHDLHKAYGYVKVSKALQSWLDEKNAPRHEVSLAFKELGWLYGFVEEDYILAEIHKDIAEKYSVHIEPIADEHVISEISKAIDELYDEDTESVPAKNFADVENEPEKPEEVYEPEKEDVVNHPKHYQLANGIEAIDLMEKTSTASEFVGHLRNTALKYIIRAGHKDPSKYVQDLDKAKWYITKLQEFHSKCEDKEY